MPKSNKKRKEIYLDYSASVSPNPSSIHSLGVEAKNKLQNARKEVANVLGARSDEMIFTSGGTEGNNLAIQGVINAILDLTLSPLSLLRRGVGERLLPHIVTTNIEHPSVLETCKLLAKRKFAEISIVPVEANGIVDPKKIKKEIKKNTVLVSVMYANNEIGTIQPIKEIVREIRHYRKTKPEGFLHGLAGVGDPENRGPEKNLLALRALPFFHTDAVQAVNYLDLNVERLGVDLLTLSGAKIEDSGRVGILFKRKSVTLAPVFGGGDQEGGIRPGTENLPAIIKFADALVFVQKNKEKENKRLTELRDYFIEKLLLLNLKNNTTNSAIAENVGNCEIILNGDRANRLPNNVNITIPKIPSDLLVIELSAKGIMTSSKSACKSSRSEGSYVIKAICPRSNSEIGGVRFSLGRDTTKKDIDYTVKALSEILQKLKKWYH
jgi:cysteine desulfurase